MDKPTQLLFCEIVAQLLIADAAVTDDEREFLARLMDRFALTDDERQAVINRVNIGEPVGERVDRLPLPARQALLVELEAAANVDGELAPGERAIIHDVRQALG